MTIFVYSSFFLLVHLFCFATTLLLWLSAVEIKVIKDLPWPPPVGQLNTASPLVEVLEASPDAPQATQLSPGQSSSALACEQYHQGGSDPRLHVFFMPFAHSQEQSSDALFSVLLPKTRHLPGHCWVRNNHVALRKAMLICR